MTSLVHIKMYTSSFGTYQETYRNWLLTYLCMITSFIMHTNQNLTQFDFRK